MQGMRDRGLSSDTYNPILHKALTEYYEQETLEKQPDLNLKENYEKLEKIVKNCDSKNTEKILNFLDNNGGGGSVSFDEAAINKFKELLSSDQIVGKEVPDEQINYLPTIVMLFFGLSSMGLMLVFFPAAVNVYKINVMELAYASSLVAWFTMTMTLLAFTRKAKPNTDETDADQNRIRNNINQTPDDMHHQLLNRLKGNMTRDTCGWQNTDKIPRRHYGRND